MVDDDCNDLVDDDPVDPAIWFADLDGDGFGDPENTQIACFEEDGWVADNTDCDDGDGDVNPEAEWYRDAEQGHGRHAQAEVVHAGSDPDSPDIFVPRAGACLVSR